MAQSEILIQWHFEQANKFFEKDLHSFCEDFTWLCDLYQDTPSPFGQYYLLACAAITRSIIEIFVRSYFKDYPPLALFIRKTRGASFFSLT
jgi:hypothetical protein